MDMDIGWCNGGEELFFNAVRASYTYWTTGKLVFCEKGEFPPIVCEARQL